MSVESCSSRFEAGTWCRGGEAEEKELRQRENWVIDAGYGHLLQIVGNDKLIGLKTTLVSQQGEAPST